MSTLLIRTAALPVAIALIVMAGCQHPRDLREARQVVHPEARQIAYRASEAVPYEPLETYSPPRTVSQPENSEQELKLSLDEAIRIALANSEVLRVLTGAAASSSGRTIYDPGIANTVIDQERGRFDPTLTADNTFSQNEQPVDIFIPGPPGATIAGTNTDGYRLDAGLSDVNALGGTARLGVGAVRSAIIPGIFPLNPQTTSFTELSYVQPLLQGGGLQANLAPVFIAGIDTERSFFQLKGAVQETVNGVISAYWSLVFARTDQWARQQQVDRAMFAYDRELARKDRGIGDLADVAQTRVALTSFQANLVSAKANVLQSEAALLNILGISPTEVGEVIPTTPPHVDRLKFEWSELVGLTERYRPDLIELKLIIEADQQRVLIAQNNALPSVDAVASYRWDGLQGRTPGGTFISTSGDEFTDWTLGVNFSVPLGLRQARAQVRQQELLVARDRANLRQGLHAAVHQLALSVRGLDQSYEQYLAFQQSRDAARDNLNVQQSEFDNGRSIFLNVLQAITDWGNAVSSEAQALTQYNTGLADLELQTGTILEAHGVRFVQERQQFAGPLGCFQDICYPTGIRPTENSARYPVGEEPAEESFDLENPVDSLQNTTPHAEPVPPQPAPIPELQTPLTPMPSPQSRRPPSLNKPLFVPQGVNRVEFARPVRGIEAEEDADSARK